MANKFFLAFSNFTVIINRVLAQVDSIVHYVSGYLVFYLLGGMKAQYHVRPSKLRNGDRYSPSVVVTGASEGIGLATALHLARKGYTIFATVHSDSEIPKVKEASQDVDLSAGGSIHPVIMDVLFQDSIASALHQITTALNDETTNKPLIGVINNAGYCMISPMELTPDKAVREIFELDFWAYINVIRAFLPMIKKNKGRFINVCSYGAYVNPPMWAPYSAVKAAIEGLTRAWRFELRPFGVGMATIRPGWTRTHGIGPKIASAWNKYYDEIPSGAIGVNSLGEIIKTDFPITESEREVYDPMMSKWHKLVLAAADGIGEPAEAVASTIHDAMIDPFLQPNYTVGYDALLGQMARDLTPETVYEVVVAKTFE